MLVHHRITLSITFASTLLYTWVERGTVRVKCLGHEHNPKSLGRTQTRTIRSGLERALDKSDSAAITLRLVKNEIFRNTG